ncbi:HNH endonuclease [Tissierella sp.]|uniref:HNH endonuclease n=1 Tax=Tissierella sp. TaxID=41274 RepID=UPI00306928CC
MTFNPKLKIGQVINNDDLREIFKCGNMGGMRKSNTTNTLVIVSDHTKGLYEDRWEGDVLHYTGMGKNGDQGISFAQNRTLYESNSNGVDVFLFEVITKRQYIYMGQVFLCDEPYQEEQPGEDGAIRNVWIFPVRLVDNQEVSMIADDLVKQNFNEKQKKIRRMSIGEIENKAKATEKKNTGTRITATTTYERNPYIIEYAKRKANGICQLCNQPAPYKNKEGEPYLETHHIVWLSKGGSDTINNTVALCPNCHRKMHILDFEKDRTELIEVAKKNIK